MFGQLVPWYDCDNLCTYCSQRHFRDGVLPTPEKRRRLMKASAYISTECNQYTKFGLMGGELFGWEGLDREWRCVGESISILNADTIFIASHLMHDDISQIEKFLDLFSSKKNVQICTSWDKVGRFHTPERFANWKKNVERLHDSGYRLVCTSILSQETVTSEPEIPDYMFMSVIEPFPECKFWYDKYKPVDGETSRIALLNSDVPLNLPRREDALGWLGRHPLTCQNFMNYKDNHAKDIIEYKDGSYQITVGDRFDKYVEQCGHPYGFRCYSDDDRCIQCDLKERFKW